MIRKLDEEYGPDARDRPAAAAGPPAAGARAALESFYHALDHRDAAVLAADWSDHPRPAGPKTR